MELKEVISLIKMENLITSTLDNSTKWGKKLALVELSLFNAIFKICKNASSSSFSNT